MTDSDTQPVCESRWSRFSTFGEAKGNERSVVWPDAEAATDVVRKTVRILEGTHFLVFAPEELDSGDQSEDTVMEPGSFALGGSES